MGAAAAPTLAAISNLKTRHGGSRIGLTGILPICRKHGGAAVATAEGKQHLCSGVATFMENSNRSGSIRWLTATRYEGTAHRSEPGFRFGRKFPAAALTSQSVRDICASV